MSEIKPVVMTPDEKAREYAQSIAPAVSEKDGPLLHATKDMRRLATPWSVAIARASLLNNNEIPTGIVLDPACGSGTQLAAICTTLERPGIGVELSGSVAPMAAINIDNCGKWDGKKWSTSSRVLWGDGTNAKDVIETFTTQTSIDQQIAILHVDPARPNDAQKHTLDEMEPRLDVLLSAWAPFLKNGAALILDLSPRLSNKQREQVDQIVSEIWGDIMTTWQWMTQGRGRIDRLSLWVGTAACSQPNRLVRLSKSGEIHHLEGKNKTSQVSDDVVEIGEFLSIIDPCLIASGLAESWKEIATSGKSRWNTITGRRPILITSEPILLSYNELSIQKETYDMAHSFVQIKGEVVAHISTLDFESLSEITQIATKLGLSSLKIRCTVDPTIQPKLQSALDREMRQSCAENSTNLGFITEASNGYVICKEMGRDPA
tara:strand:- start:96 stop:1394 length:1299 start_codon:yes stop_codon:yes gene_type:complete